MDEINSKISRIDNTSQTKAPQTVKGESKSDKTHFSDLLSNQIEQKSSSTKSSSKSLASQGLPELDASFKAHLFNTAQDPSTTTQKLQDSLDLFDRYAAFLGDPDKSLKESYTILEQVLDQVKTLSEDIKSAPSNTSNNDLKQIVLQLMTTAQVEQIKFDRGDYL